RRERRHLAPERVVRCRAAVLQMVGDERRRAPSVAEGEADAAAGHRRDPARGIADEKHARRADRAEPSAGGNEARAPSDDLELAPAERGLGARDERREVWPIAMADGEADLQHIRSGCGPADVTGRERRIDEAVEEARID